MRDKLVLSGLIPVLALPGLAMAQVSVPSIGGPSSAPYLNQQPPASQPIPGLTPTQAPQQLPANRAPINPASGAAFVIAPPPVINPIDQSPVPLTDKEAAGSSITTHWRNAHSMPSTGSDGTVVFSYGATQPSIVCAPLTICLLRLQAGESVLQHGLQIGDGARWRISPTVAGNNQTVLVIKPTDAGLRTTLAVMTNKRVYSIRLVSVQSESKSMAISEFSYPEEEKEAWNEYYANQNKIKENNTLPTGGNIANLDFGYVMSGDTPSWRPMRVYNDGVHTYIQFPNAMRSSDAPSLLTLAHDGTWFSSPTKQLVNYRKEGDTYVVDKVFDRAELITGVGDSQDRVVIVHKGE